MRFRLMSLGVGMALALSASTVLAETASVALNLVWTTPGDDGASGTATTYDLRYSTSPISSSNFANAIRAAFVPKPGTPGSLQSCSVTGLTVGTPYYFALRTADERGNWSPVSNVAYFDGRSVAVEGSAPAIDFSPPWPNPAASSTQFSLTLPQRTSVRVEVFDAMGRRVRALLSGEQPAGYTELVWNLTDDAGRPVGAGVYLARAQIDGRTFTRRIISTR